jgi:DNA polymerase-4
MEREPGLKWLFLDLNSYFASVEQQERPELRGRPVAVVPMPTDSTCAIAASYEAKLYGIKTGTKIYDARQMCPSLRCVLARHDVYVDYHNRVIDEVIKHTPINKIWSIDELSSRLPPGRRAPEEARKVAQRIKTGLRDNVGEKITCSIGIAPNSLLAKMATDMKKPDGLVVIRQEDLRDALFPLRLTAIPGIGANMERRLVRAGITSMEKFWNTSPKQARKIWGSVQGERMWYWLHGYDFEPPESGNVMIGHSRVLDPALRRADKARLMARRLLVKATYRLRRKGYYARALSLGARSTAGYRWGGEVRLPPAHDPFTFLKHLDDLWLQMMADFSPGPAPSFRKVSVVLHHLCADNQVTDDMFESGFRENAAQLQKKESLARALDHLQAKYQKETVWLGTVPKTLGGHVGTKIAFARVPEAEEFWS